ncbi:MAG: aspartate--ammonia ligase [Spirochaetales bacterium]|jgi:aspartate--ammonia ligase|nr:aspartate--ammonia ligase [Spirochaetales bacterium]
MKQQLFPEGYAPLLDQKQTEKAIKLVKDTFERELSGELRLSRITSPLFVPMNSGINDDLSGVERPVRFEVGNMDNRPMEIVQSLAKWKRMALADHGVEAGMGIYTDMNAIRPDDTIDIIHSIYVDQWDWERVMLSSERNLEFLKTVVRGIYKALKRTEFLVSENYGCLDPFLPEDIMFIESQSLISMFPGMGSKDRERAVAKRFGAVFIIGIGHELSNGEPHDSRAPDYDDWSTPNSDGCFGLNGDIIVWDDVINDSLELSSMGIRVDRDALVKQLKIRHMESRASLYWHKRLLAGDFPQTIGGGIGQSRICMLLLRKAHIGEVQASVWPQWMYDEARKAGSFLM